MFKNYTKLFKVYMAKHRIDFEYKMYVVAMERDTGAKIIIRGKGSVKEGKVGRKDGQPLPGEDEPLHAYVTANNPECVKKAVDKVNILFSLSIFNFLNLCN